MLIGRLRRGQAHLALGLEAPRRPLFRRGRIISLGGADFARVPLSCRGLGIARLGQRQAVHVASPPPNFVLRP